MAALGLDGADGAMAQFLKGAMQSTGLREMMLKEKTNELSFFFRRRGTRDKWLRATTTTVRCFRWAGGVEPRGSSLETGQLFCLFLSEAMTEC